MMKHEPQFGKYRLLQTLGSGGFAKVYLGEHIYLKTQAAIKVLFTGSDLTHEEVQRFLKEARTIAQLRHPHIINILDFDVDNGTPYLVMEYAPYGSMYARYPGMCVLEPQDVLSYVKQVASALQFAHDHQVVHCDIKPENMLLNARDEVLLSDFGIAVVLHSSLKTQAAVGTMLFMAPEQFIGKPVPASDQYGLAVVVYSWLCGQLPFNSKNASEMYRLHTETPPRSLREINPKISRELEQVVLTALAKNPKKRFASVDAFAKALEQATQSKRFSVPTVAPSFSPSAKPKTQEPQDAEPQPLLPSLSSLLPLASPDKEPAVADPALPTHYPLTQLAHSPEAAAKELSAPGETPISPSQRVTLPAIEGMPTISVPPASPTSPPFPTLRSVDEPEPANTSSSATEGYPSHDISITVHARAEKPFTLPVPRPLDPVLPLSEESHLTYRKHTGWVSTVAWSPDSTRLASGSTDTTVHVWDATFGTTLLTYQGHSQCVKSVSWSPDGGYIASGSWDNTVQVWDAATGDMLLNKYNHEAQVEAVAWSPDGRHIASAGYDGLVHVWRPFNKNNILIYSGHSRQIHALAWSPDGKYIASSSDDQTVQMWEARNGKLLLTYRNHQNPLAAVAWSGDGLWIASGDNQGVLHVWSATDGSLLQTYQSEDNEAGAIKALAWSPDSTHLAAAAQFVRIWRIANSRPTTSQHVYRGHTDWVNSMAWSPDGRMIASASDDETVQLWNPYAA